MSGELTQAGANRAVKAGVGQTVTAASGMYVALGTALPGTPDTATLADYVTAGEVTTAGYSRQAVTWDAPTGDPSQVVNTLAVTFGAFEADPPSVGYCWLCDTSTGPSGTVLAYWTLEAARDGASGDQLQFAAGELRLAVD